EPLVGRTGCLGGVFCTLLGRGQRRLHARLQLGTNGLVALVPLLVLTVALDLALDVGHEGSSTVVGKQPYEVSGPASDAATPHEGAFLVVVGTVLGEMETAGSRKLDRYRSIAVLAHIDHGKTTLSDRILELCGAVDPREMRAQYLDSMDLERERGITIKAQNVRLEWKGHVLHLIDTPGHVDFGYEVSRSLAAAEGGVLLGDASQGIEAQTPANCYAALEADLTIVAALNKIDLPAAEPERRAEEIERVLGIPADDILRISAKTGEGVPELLDAIVEQIPAPVGDAGAPPQARIFA